MHLCTFVCLLLAPVLYLSHVCCYFIVASSSLILFTSPFFGPASSICFPSTLHWLQFAADALYAALMYNAFLKAALVGDYMFCSNAFLPVLPNIFRGAIFCSTSAGNVGCTNCITLFTRPRNIASFYRLFTCMYTESIKYYHYRYSVLATVAIGI